MFNLCVCVFRFRAILRCSTPSRIHVQFLWFFVVGLLTVNTGFTFSNVKMGLDFKNALNDEKIQYLTFCFIFNNVSKYNVYVFGT